ncbi:hypothetical protein AJ80_01097 [Polytolypa hystricis UAMH7299]|uniref:Uncharacterized protein n=1 Tax=Polytolypa hystricis (strain UAMH7299) TaxID=1447883 RepID=A0A2B7Z1D4_POLH7|nr:hypothetical protein AJ80_01097 [Polytolypa hystricis UAMH7299]
MYENQQPDAVSRPHVYEFQFLSGRGAEEPPRYVAARELQPYSAIAQDAANGGSISATNGGNQNNTNTNNNNHDVEAHAPATPLGRTEPAIAANPQNRCEECERLQLRLKQRPGNKSVICMFFGAIVVIVLVAVIFLMVQR